MKRIKDNRNYAIDAGRILFAFLVVTLHMGMMGGAKLLPLARCAVPFFYVLSGYYMFRPDDETFGQSILRNFRKWLKLYAVYLVLFFFISCLLKYIVPGNNYIWTRNDSQAMLLEGVCRFVDVVKYGGKDYGIMTLWFLYAGTWGMLMLYLLRRHVRRKYSIIWLMLFHLIVVGINYNIFEERVVPRFFTAAVPALYLGAYMRYHENTIVSIFCKYKKAWLSTGFVVSYLETFILEGYNEIYYTTLFFTAILFMFLKTYNSKWAHVISNIPTKCTLDIYVWHRLAFFLISLTGLQMGGFSSICVFTIVFIVSFTIRKSKSIMAYKTTG